MIHGNLYFFHKSFFLLSCLFKVIPKKGIFITTSDFPKSAYDYVNAIDPKIILIDGDQLTEFMIENNVGVTLQGKFEIKKIDADYFEADWVGVALLTPDR